MIKQYIVSDIPKVTDNFLLVFWYVRNDKMQYSNFIYNQRRQCYNICHENEIYFLKKLLLEIFCYLSDMRTLRLFFTIATLFMIVLVFNQSDKLALSQESQTMDFVNETMKLGNITTSNTTLVSPQNTTLVYPQTVSIAPGSSNPAASEFYVPSEITVPARTTITWTNDDTTIHTVTEQDGSFDSGIMSPRSIWKYTFDTAGEFDYYCSLHPFMTGKVIVK